MTATAIETRDVVSADRMRDLAAALDVECDAAHGPLLAIYLAELARAHGGTIPTFDFRLRRPVFVADLIRVQDTPSEDRRSAELAVVSGDGTVHATATASFGS